MTRSDFLIELSKLICSMSNELEGDYLVELKKFLKRIQNKEFHLKSFCIQNIALFNYMEEELLKTTDEKEIVEQIRDCIFGADERNRYFKEEEKAVQQCEWNIAWMGRCKEPAENGSRFCKKHQQKCCSCGEPATHECEETGQFVCGAPLCNECTHLIFPDGSNGGVGFNAQLLPEGYTKNHIKKVDQPKW